jgi:hypothetical protein
MRCTLPRARDDKKRPCWPARALTIVHLRLQVEGLNLDNVHSLFVKTLFVDSAVMVSARECSACVPILTRC